MVTLTWLTFNQDFKLSWVYPTVLISLCDSDKIAGSKEDEPEFQPLKVRIVQFLTQAALQEPSCDHQWNLRSYERTYTFLLTQYYDWRTCQSAQADVKMNEQEILLLIIIITIISTNWVQTVTLTKEDFMNIVELWTPDLLWLKFVQHFYKKTKVRCWMGNFLFRYAVEEK